MISSRRDHRATLFVKSSRDTDRSRHYGDSNVDEDLIPQNRQRQQSVRRNNRQHDESDVVYNLPSANERMERPAPRAKHSPLRNMAPRDEAPGDEEPRDETSRDEESNVEEPRHEIRPAIDLPMREDELLERHIESAEDLRGRHDKIDEISNKSHKKEEPVDEHEDPPLGKRLHPAYADPASSNRKSPVAVNIEDGMEAAVEVADERQNDVIEEDPQLVDVPLPMLTSGHAATGIFDKDIGRVADFRKFVVLTVVDSGYVPIAINFYRTSVATIGLTNFMMVCTDRLAMRMLRLQGIACSLYIVPKVGHVTVSCVYCVCAFVSFHLSVDEREGSWGDGGELHLNYGCMMTMIICVMLRINEKHEQLDQLFVFTSFDDTAAEVVIARLEPILSAAICWLDGKD